MERIDEIIQRALENRKEAEPQHRGTNAGRDPGDRLIGRPAEDEEPRGKEHGPDHHGRKPRFWNGFVAVGDVASVVELIVKNISEATERNTSEESEEGQRADEFVPAALFLEFDREGGEVGVEDAVAEGGVQRDGETDGCQQHLEGADAELLYHLACGDVPFFEFGVQRPVAGLDAQAPGFVDEESLGVGLVEDEDVEG